MTSLCRSRQSSGRCLGDPERSVNAFLWIRKTVWTGWGGDERSVGGTGVRVVGAVYFGTVSTPLARRGRPPRPRNRRKQISRIFMDVRFGGACCRKWQVDGKGRLWNSEGAPRGSFLNHVEVTKRLTYKLGHVFGYFKLLIRSSQPKTILKKL